MLYVLKRTGKRLKQSFMDLKMSGATRRFGKLVKPKSGWRDVIGFSRTIVQNATSLNQVTRATNMFLGAYDELAYRFARSQCK